MTDFWRDYMEWPNAPDEPRRVSKPGWRGISMHVKIEVDVATARPPRTHATIYTSLSVDLRRDLSLSAAMHAAELNAKETAMLMAMKHPHVVMVLGARVTEIEEI